MKKLCLLILVVMASQAIVQAQELRLNGYASYVFDNRFDTWYSNTSYFNGIIKGSLQWGLGLEFLPAEEVGVELVYYRQDTEVDVNYYDFFAKTRTLDLAINYIMVGGTSYLHPNPTVEPYGGILLGMAVYDNKSPQSGEPSSSTKFAWGLRLGLNLWPAERVGIKMQAQLLSAVQAWGGGFYFGSGGGGAGVSTFSTLYSFSLGGGLIIKLKE